jgi:hypothetical protein
LVALEVHRSSFEIKAGTVTSMHGIPDGNRRTHASAAPICVVATSIAATRVAMVTAAALAEPLDAHVHVIAARLMPAEWSLEQQSAPAQAFAKEIKQLTSDMRTAIDILPCVCRRMLDVTQLLPRGAVVVVAGPTHRWWPTREQRLAHDLSALGHRVLFVHAHDQMPAE